LAPSTSIEPSGAATSRPSIENVTQLTGGRGTYATAAVGSMSAGSSIG